METEIASAGRFASVEVVSTHLTSLDTYAIKTELFLPVPNSTDKRKILARDALDMFRQLPIDDNFWHIPFLAPLAPEQRMYHVSLDLFQWPHKVIVRTPQSKAYPTPGCSAGLDILIHTHTVPQFIWLELVYAKRPDAQTKNESDESDH